MCLAKSLRRVVAGAGRIFDFSRSYDRVIQVKYLKTPSSVIDRDSLSSDWENIGQDFKSAINRFKKEYVVPQR